MSKLSGKQRKFVSAYIKKPNATEAAMQAYDASNRKVAQNIGSENLSKPIIQQAIDAALLKVGATPEFAVNQLYTVAQQDEELGAKRLAAKDILELHGWQRGNRPESRLTIENAFFGNSREIPTIEQQP